MITAFREVFEQKLKKLEKKVAEGTRSPQLLYEIQDLKETLERIKKADKVFMDTRQPSKL